jgi:predicted lipoprotein with Yx(FWY)xxD motif
MRNRWWAAPVLAGAAVLLTACGSSSAPAASTSSPTTTPSSTSPASSGAVIKTMSTSVGTVLSNANGDTLYWFAIDTPTKSNCTGSCATYWPPVIGKVSAAPGTTLPHGFGTITRSNGQLQATYDGHPLYTYAGDTAPGQVNGNGKDVSGGLWWAMTPSGARPTTPTPSSSTTSASTGY